MLSKLTVQAGNLAKLADGKTILLEELLNDQDVPLGVAIKFNLTSWQRSE
jgi:hypothetical protein